jgi:hypothetical protein
LSDRSDDKPIDEDDKKYGCADGCVDGCLNSGGCVDPDGCEGCFHIAGGILCGIYWLAVHIGHFLAHHVPHV